MTRVLIGEGVFFLVPFAIFFVYLAIRQRNPLTFAAWEKSIPWLVIAGAGCVVLALLVTGLSAPRSKGVYVPPRVENGQVIPGHFE